jgi:hypothetical protein
MKMRKQGWIVLSLNWGIKRKSSCNFILKRGYIRKFLKKPRTFSLIVSLPNSVLNLQMKFVPSFALSYNFLCMSIKSGCIHPMVLM